MKSFLLSLAWLGAVLLLALQRGSGAKATPTMVVGSKLGSNHPSSIPGRLTRLARHQPSAPGELLMGARIPRRQRPVENLVFLDQLDALVDEEKREFDDYGHMRFGKRAQQQAAAFDDYGHMRFGRSGSAAAIADQSPSLRQFQPPNDAVE
ncbi:drosulfakinins [Neocloeon triangulifer]|uniref:drosulfakinins n=1 Tax=Neocloeon triangulifer TaxID=2078957 RepID=UPI00286F1043|nr:drosulfakinins [Neocloeon triangulifer]XP_059482730.1 drosulfakinins [Neocloeon triangulifer]